MTNRRGFTLIELLVAMGIIVLLIVLALPAFNFITGSRSGESAGNQLSAALGIARAQAVGLQQTRGVAVFYDPDADRSTAVLVELRVGAVPPHVAGTAAAPVTYGRGQYAVDGANTYVCLQTYTDKGQISPAGDTNQDFWRVMPSMKTVSGLNTLPVLEVVTGGDYMQLPKGVELRGVGNQFRWPNDTITSTDPTYQYTNPAVVLFDGAGQALVTPFVIAQEGLLGEPVRKAGGFVPLGNTTVTPLPYGFSDKPSGINYNVSSQIGLVNFERSVFQNAIPASATPAELAEWLNQNATPLMLNRYNGTLVKGE